MKKGKKLQFRLLMNIGNYYVDEKTVAELKNTNRIVFTYADGNADGSTADIAGVLNETRQCARHDAAS